MTNRDEKCDFSVGFDSYYTSDCNIKAYTVAKEIAINRFKNKGKPIVLYASCGNGKAHLIKSILSLSRLTGAYKKIHVIACTQIKDEKKLNFKLTEGLVIVQHGQSLSCKSNLQLNIKDLFENFNYAKGNIVITTDTPIKAVIDFSFHYTEIIVNKPDFELKEKVLKNKFPSKFIKEMTYDEVVKICKANWKSIRELECIVISLYCSKITGSSFNLNKIIREEDSLN